MNIMRSRSKYASVVWIEPKRVCVDSKYYNFCEKDTLHQLSQVIAPLPFKQTYWIVDDALVPTLLLHGITELSPDSRTRDAFFSWRYSQILGLDTPQIVQALKLEEAVWLLSGVDRQQFDTWNQLSIIAGHHICKLLPRWAWLYNRLAPTREVPGILLSLSAADNETFTGTLVAWKNNLFLLRQWTESASVDVWNMERVLPTIAYLKREGCSPQELCVWGSTCWPDCGIYTQIIQPEIPSREII
jgi:hypothetical protein